MHCCLGTRHLKFPAPPTSFGSCCTWKNQALQVACSANYRCFVLVTSCGLKFLHDFILTSVRLASDVSWGFLWPFINTHAGDWYPADPVSNDFKGLYGYKTTTKDDNYQVLSRLALPPKVVERFISAIQGIGTATNVSGSTHKLLVFGLKSNNSTLVIF
ncbi:probable metal-nicotianamine transporter YSL14 isoform X2 [Papaver somniferum]|uniref:probable metal-nicotianamine transporter YSL14 isoform X2 n=1 Tax=Papaver somniferum TaxID=3469 RepID=UPI000E700D57|nr:probable metal-nicotianamine transporter YSL14 isoform X2 [Papaver somniferum]